MIHVLQAAQHLRAQEEHRVISSMRAAFPGRAPGEPSLAGFPENEACCLGVQDPAERMGFERAVDVQKSREF